MLKKFSVENFKCFPKKFVLDLSSPGNYAFNQECIRNGIINKACIYGVNGIGKSNLGLAIFDIVNTLTDKNKVLYKYEAFKNLNCAKPYATFEYEFDFDGDTVVYKYSKIDANILVTESLQINNKEMIFFDYNLRKGVSYLEGSEALNLENASPNSRVKYVMETAILKDGNKENIVLGKFKSFVNSMLLFYSLKENNFIGFKDHGSSLENIVISAGKVKELEDFINSQGLNVRLVAANSPEGKKLCFKFDNGLLYFFKECSTGMSSLVLLFTWLLEMKNCSFVYIDEFDAFYHYELAEMIVKELKKFTDTQIIVTTHNTDLMNNDLMRPDCYFVLSEEKIDSLNHMTEKDIRFAHNLQKMFKSGSFNE
ncbi:MAG: ATP-binding protein [Bacilli bacterium]|nr:ATP-binding protein [Bacilli bacterium]MDD3841716.1 ATP-binding protein [Bacilli bacterium]